MLVFGAVDFLAALVRVAKVLGYQVTVCDAREVLLTRARFPRTDEVVVDWPDRLLGRVGSSLTTPGRRVRPHHDAKFDVPALVAALGTDVGYVGAMGSQAHPRRPGWHAPGGGRGGGGGPGPHPGADRARPGRAPEETAVSICAEIIAQRTGRAGAAAAARHRRPDPPVAG